MPDTPLHYQTIAEVGAPPPLQGAVASGTDPGNPRSDWVPGR